MEKEDKQILAYLVKKHLICKSNKDIWYLSDNAKKALNKMYDIAITKSLQNASEYDKDFEEFWKLYPNCQYKVNYDKAKYSYRQLRPLYEQQIIIDGLKAWIASNNWKNNDGFFVCSPYKFLKTKMFLRLPKKSITKQDDTSKFDEEAFLNDSDIKEI